MLTRRVLPRLVSRPSVSLSQPAFRRTLIAAPRPGSTPLLERRADRELPGLSALDVIVNYADCHK